MKIKIYIQLLPIALLFFVSCGNGNQENKKTDNSTEANPNAYEGADIRMEVIEFDMNKNETNVIFLNGSDKSIKNVTGKLVFMNDDGKEITFATGASKASSFQVTESPHVVAAKSKVNYKLYNKIDKNTKYIEVLLESIETTDGESIQF
jgi:hypothetical protein